MPLDLDGLADLVVLTVKNAIAPLQQRLALVEQENANLRERLAVVPELRDRIVTVETKSAMPMVPPAVLEAPDALDVSPIIARVSVLEQGLSDTKAALGVVTELRDRVVIVETKSATPPPAVPMPDVDLTPINAALERLTNRIDPVERAVGELNELLVKHSASPQDVELMIRKSLDPVVSDFSLARERIATLEARAPIPGPPGKDGANGVDGKDGKDGAPGRDGLDGLSVDDMDVRVDENDSRTVQFKFERGSLRKTFPLKFPGYLRHQGVYIEGKSYEHGDVVTWAGSQWHANTTTTSKPGEGLSAWTLIVKRGRDGKDGKDASEPMPVVSVRR